MTFIQTFLLQFFLVFVLCRRGNDSQKAVRILKDSMSNHDVQIKDIVGGIHAWTRNIDPGFPIY